MDKRYQKCILTNMCMVIKGDEILVVNRNKTDWPGISFPGGHVELNESIEESLIREMKEETGLIIKNPILKGVYEWKREENNRYLAFLYVANEFDGTLNSSNEGKVFWIKRNELSKYKWSTDFDKIYEILSR